MADTSTRAKGPVWTTIAAAAGIYAVTAPYLVVGIMFVFEGTRILDVLEGGSPIEESVGSQAFTMVFLGVVAVLCSVAMIVLARRLIRRKAGARDLAMGLLIFFIVMNLVPVFLVTGVFSKSWALWSVALAGAEIMVLGFLLAPKTRHEFQVAQNQKLGKQFDRYARKFDKEQARRDRREARRGPG